MLNVLAALRAGGGMNTHLYSLYEFEPAHIDRLFTQSEWHEETGKLPDLGRYLRRDVEGKDALDRLLHVADPARVTWRCDLTDTDLAGYLGEIRDALKLPLADGFLAAMADLLLVLEGIAAGRVAALRRREQGRERYQPWQDADLVAEVEAVCGPGRKAGKHYRFPCPFHADKSPSLTVDAARKLWYCWPCSKGGGVVAWRKAIEGVAA